VGRPAIARILVVDDSITVAKFTEMVLAAAGHDIIFAMDGIECMQKLGTGASDIDLIILDVVMPGKNGFQLCREIKTNDQFNHLPVIIMTTKGQDADKFWGKRQGADAYLVKPCPDELLISTVNQFLPLSAKEGVKTGPSGQTSVAAPANTDAAAPQMSGEKTEEPPAETAKIPSAPVLQTVECNVEEIPASEPDSPQKDMLRPTDKSKDMFYSFNANVHSGEVAEKPETYKEAEAKVAEESKVATREAPELPREEPKKKPLSLRERLQKSFYRFSN